MFPGCCCIANSNIGARERRQLIPHVRFQVPFLGPESQLKSGFACAGLLCHLHSMGSRVVEHQEPHQGFCSCATYGFAAATYAPNAGSTTQHASYAKCSIPARCTLKVLVKDSGNQQEIPVSPTGSCIGCQAAQRATRMNFISAWSR